MRSESPVHALWSAYGIGRGNASGDDAMLTGAMVLKRAMVVVALALSTGAVVGDTARAAPDAVPDDASTSGSGQTCVAEHWVWTGSTTLDEVALVFDTTVTVPIVAGTELFVAGVAADGLAADGQARALTVTVGGRVAVPGRKVPGGPVMVLGDGAAAQLNSAVVMIDRCSMVQVAAPVGGGRSATLPSTGFGMDTSIIGALAIGVGAGMMVLGRRRANT